MSCPYVAGNLKARLLQRLLTQYQESDKFKAYLQVFGDELEAIEQVYCTLYGGGDLQTATGSQLDQLGNGAGWPRCHCEGRQVVAFGFATNCNQPTDVVGWCDGNWAGPACGGLHQKEEYCFTDDDLYRRFIAAKTIRNRSNGSIEDMEAALIALFGNDAVVLFEDQTTLTVGTGRVLSAEERLISHLFELVLPKVRGVKLEIIEVVNHFGIGTGWGGWCTGEFGKPIGLGGHS